MELSNVTLDGEPSYFGSSVIKVGDTWPKALALLIISSLSPQGNLRIYRGSAEAEILSDGTECVILLCNLKVIAKLISFDNS